MNQRIQYFDFLRGLAIMMVVAIHTSGGSSWSTIELSVRQVINCAVPLFLAISGFFLANKNVSTKQLYCSFLKKQIPKVYFPVLIWSLPLLVLSLYHGKDILKSVTLFFVCGYSIYYFIALIIQYYVMLPILQRLTFFGGSIALIITVISIFVFKYVITVELPLIIYGGVFIMWIVFFVAGVLLGKMESRNYNISIWVIWVVVSFICTLFETDYLHSTGEKYLGIKTSTHIMSLGIIILLFSQKIQSLYRENMFTSIIAKIGSVSFGVYLIHCFIIIIFGGLSLNWIVQWILVLVLSCGIVMCGRKISSCISSYIGFNQ